VSSTPRRAGSATQLLDTDLTDAFGRAQAASRRIMVVRASIVDVTSMHEHVALMVLTRRRDVMGKRSPAAPCAAWPPSPD
jgi:hypothetical protein